MASLDKIQSTYVHPPYMHQGWVVTGDYKFRTSPPVTGDDQLRITNEQLHEHHKNRITAEKGEFSLQVWRNHLSALNTYQTFCGKSPESPVGRELTFDFSENSGRFVDAVCSNKKTAADKMSLLRAWKTSVDELIGKKKCAPDSGASEFHQALRIALAKSELCVLEIAKAIGANPAVIQRWIRGAYPFNKSVPTLRRLEAYLGCDRDFLAGKAIQHRPAVQIPAAVQPDQYLKRLKANCKDHYRLKVSELSDEFKEEWASFLRYKTSEFPTGLERADRAKWRNLPVDKVGRIARKSTMAQVNPEVISTSAIRFLGLVSSYFGFLTKQKSSDARTSGLGVPLSQVQTLAMFAIPELLNAYFEFVKARAGNCAHSGLSAVAGLIASMVRPEEGYLAQQAAMFLPKIEGYANGRTWQQLCNETRSLCLAWHKAGVGTKSRDPKTPLANLLKLSNPLDPLKQAIKKLDIAAANASPGSIRQATFKRNALILAMEIANPLRLRTFTIAKYIPANMPSEYETNLFEMEDGSWRLRFNKGDFKNDQGRDEDYDAPLPTALNRRIDEYLHEYRTVLVRKAPCSPWLFPNTLGQMHHDLSGEINSVAKQFIPEVTRLRAHGLRHIVASDFLTKNPGQYVVIAELLHDTLETVLRTYAHFKTESAFNAHEEHLKSFFQGI